VELGVNFLKASLTSGVGKNKKKLFTESRSDAIQKGPQEVSGPTPIQNRMSVKLDPASKF